MSAVGVALLAVGALLWLLALARAALVAARMLQIEEYEWGRFVRWGSARAWLAHRSVLLAAGVTAAGLIASALHRDSATIAAGVAWIVASGGALWWWGWTPPKRALVLTARMRRILGAAGAVATLLAALPPLVAALGVPVVAAALVLVLTAALTALALLVLIAGDALMRPVESAVRERYLRLATARIAEVQPLVVAVAGSYGKTSTKHILAQLLPDQERVLPTRKSFNTLMGVTRVINEDLRPEHRLFIVEMDAYAPGEIAAMCALVHPKLAIVTSVGPQHLERFGTMDAIADTLYETVAALPPDGHAFVHAGEPGGLALAERAVAERHTVTRYGIEGTSAWLDVVASHVDVDGRGSRFVWSWRERGLEREVTIPLLGRHQVLNVAVALAVVHQLGCSLDDAIGAASRLQPVEHRLQPMATGGPVTVIDDSYNANPVGVHNGLDVLAGMDGGAKVLVTPGLVELGSAEDSENRRYGEHAAAVCDHVIVVAARPAAPLLAGLEQGGLPKDRIHVVRDLAAATAVIAAVTKAGDVVLFANDLPDTYAPTA